MLPLQLSTGRYDLLTNKWPKYARHMLLVAKDFVPQQMTLDHAIAVREFLSACSFSAFFNSWGGGGASVNHFHAQLIDELPPVARLSLTNGPLVNAQGLPWIMLRLRRRVAASYSGRDGAGDAGGQLAAQLTVHATK